jgi:hypothetical protein
MIFSLFRVSQAADQVAILLKEQNARSMSHLATARQNTQLDMFKFTDKLLAVLAGLL